jgi:pilus assembly protein CpaB
LRSRSPDEIEEEIDVKRGVLTAMVVVLLALAAAGGVFLFMNSVRERADAGRATVDVIVATQDVPAGQDLDPLIEKGVFRTKAVDSADLVPGVITDVYQLSGQRTAYPILAEEQITAARLSGPLQARGGVLGIPEGFQAASITIEPQRGVAGALQQGNHVEVFGTFSDRGDGALTTRVVIVDTLVLAVARQEASGGVGVSGSATVTLAVTPQEASLLIFAQEQGHVWLTLLPPNETGVKVPPVSLKTPR